LVGSYIVRELVERHEKRFGSMIRVFVHLDLIRNEITKVDVVLCRDCLVHFPNVYS